MISKCKVSEKTIGITIRKTFYVFYCYIYNDYSKIESLWQQLYFKELP